MPWKESCTMDEKIKFIAILMDKPDMCMSRLCQAFDISRKTGYKWLKRYLADKENGLRDLSRRPHANANAIEQHLMNKIIEARGSFPY